MAFPPARMIPVNGIELEVHEAGQGGVPLVLAHGWPDLAYGWRHQVPALVEAGYHVIIPNQRGYGRSSRPEAVEAYDIEHLTNDHVALLDTLGIDKAIYVGHDWGAIILWQLALLHPERMHGLAAMAVPFFQRQPAPPVDFWEKRLGSDYYIVHFNRQPGVAAQWFENNPAQFLRNMYLTRQWLHQGERDEDAGKIISYANRQLKNGEPFMSEAEFQVFVEAYNVSGFKSACNYYRNFDRNWHLTEQVEQRVKLPAMMIYGAHDSVPQNNMTGYVDDLEVHTLDCGHWLQQEEPEAVNRLLLGWLERRMQPLL